MTATNHALTGVAIAVAVNHPAVALPVALLTHFVMDMIPHSELKIKEIWIDILLAALTVTVVAVYLRDNVSIWLLLACAFLCASPDLVWGWRYFKFKDIQKLISAEPISWFSRWHQKIQWSETRPGILVEIVWFIGILSFILIKH
jgi:hypothetical protein